MTKFRLMGRTNLIEPRGLTEQLLCKLLQKKKQNTIISVYDQAALIFQRTMDN